MSSMKCLNDSLTVEMANCRNALKTVCYAQVYARIAQSIHRLNRQLYERLCGVKEAEISVLCANQSMPNTNDNGIAVNGSVQIPTNTDKLVVTIPEDIPLDEHERSLLTKGANFIPTTSVTDEFQVKEDNEKFFRRLRLKAHFHETSEDTRSGAHGNQLNDTIASNSSDTDANNANQQQNTGTTGIIESLKPRSSKWTPPPGQFTAVDHYFDKCRREVNQIDFEHRLTRYNLSYDELQALRKLKNRTDVVIRQADKGGTFVVWREKIPSDATQSSQQEVKSFIETAIGNNQLPPTATNINVEHPRTSKFYLLPKIHKPGNPGRPIVSACSCPTELLALYLDHVTAPFVRSLDSYGRDTTHMLNIFDSFRFQDVDGQRLIFTMDIKSLYMVIPNEGGLRALQYYLDKREILEPPTDTLLHMAELVLTLNTFEFNGEYYKQTGGVAMGS